MGERESVSQKRRIDPETERQTVRETEKQRYMKKRESQIDP